MSGHTVWKSPKRHHLVDDCLLAEKSEELTSKATFIGVAQLWLSSKETKYYSVEKIM